MINLAASTFRRLGCRLARPTSRLNITVDFTTIEFNDATEAAKDDALIYEAIRNDGTSREMVCLLVKGWIKNERKNTENERKNTENVELKSAIEIAKISSKLSTAQMEMSALAPRGILGSLYDCLMNIFPQLFHIIFLFLCFYI